MFQKIVVFIIIICYNLIVYLNTLRKKDKLAGTKGRAVVESEFEVIRYNETLPARIELIQGCINTAIHWHKEIELVYVIDGEINVSVSNFPHSLASDNFFLINSTENHRITAESAKCLILDISYEFAQQFDESLYHTVFEVVGGSGAEEELHNLLWQLSRTMNETEMPNLRQYYLITEILHVMLVQCRRENKDTSKENGKIQSRYTKLALEYIEQHFREEITEKTLADSLGVNYLHFSKLFKEETGMIFRDYVMRVRLQHSMDALMNQNMSIEDAAAAGGFPSKRTFIAKCQKVFGITPFRLLKQNRGADALPDQLSQKQS